MDLSGLRAELRRLQHGAQLLPLTEDEFFAGKENQQALYHAFRAFVERIGPITVNINKTRISFQARARFASINRVTKDGLACHLWLKRRIESPRFDRIEVLPPGNYVHHFKLADPCELDEQMGAWTAEAYEVGMQRWAPVLSPRQEP